MNDTNGPTGQKDNTMIGRIMLAIVPAFHAFAVGYLAADLMFLACR